LRALALAALAGAVIAWVAIALVLHTRFAAGGYTREALVELPPWAFGVVGGAGAAVGVMAGQYRLPQGVRGAALGGLVGVGVVAILTLAVATVLGGPSSKGQAPNLEVGLWYGVPGGLVVGGVGGLLVSRWRRA
jgi:hypothetical protein